MAHLPFKLLCVGISVNSLIKQTSGPNQKFLIH